MLRRIPPKNMEVPRALPVGLHLRFEFDTFGGAKPRFLNRGEKRRSVSTLSIPGALVLNAVEGSDRGVEWVDLTFEL
jgi:hypothetical protein